MIKINLITSWKTECGIADTARLLVNELETYDDIEINICPVKKLNSRNPIFFLKLLKNVPKNRITHIQYHSDLFGPFIPNFSLSYFPLVIFFLKFWRKNKIITTVHEIDPNSAVDNLIIKFLNLSDRLIVHNSSLINSMEKSGIKKGKLSMVPLGTLKSEIMDKTFCKNKLGASNKKVLTIFGFIGFNKGHDIVIDILPQLGEDFILLIAGESRTDEQVEYRHFLEDKISSSGLENRVKFMGFIGKETLLVVSNATDIFLYPYRWIIASAALNLALSYSVPTITSDLDYFNEIKNEYDCIELFKSENRKDLLEKIQEISSSDKKQTYLKEKCAYFNKKTSLKVSGDKTRKLYLELTH